MSAAAKGLRAGALARTPTVLQMEAAECGAASLAIILAYFGRFVPLSELREACGVSRNGSNARRTVEVAELYGLEAKGYQRSADRTLEGPFPVIVFWRSVHFLVVEGCRGDRVYLNDPALGRRTISRQTFSVNYSGVVLTFTPGAGFEVGGDRPNLLGRLASLAARRPAPIAFALCIGILLAVPSLAIPLLSAVFVDNVLVADETRLLTGIIALALLATAVQTILSWLREIVVLRLQVMSAVNLSVECVWRLLRLPLGFFETRYLGDLVSRVAGAERVARTTTTGMASALIALVTAGLMLALLSLIDPVLSLIAFAGAFLTALLSILTHRARVDLALRLRADEAMLVSTTVTGLRTIETLKASGGDDDIFARWAGYDARVINSEQQLSRLDLILIVLPATVAMATTAVALAVGGLRVIDGALTVGTLIAFQVLLSFVTAPVLAFVNEIGNAQSVAADLSRLDDLNEHALDWRHRREGDAQRETAANARRERRDGDEAGLVLDGVTFSFTRAEPPVVADICIDLPPGAWLGIVGASGSGKSTIGKLISGLYVPSHGKITLGGKPLQAHERRHLATLVAHVDHGSVPFQGTIRENVALFNNSVDDAQVIAALRDAQLLEKIERLPGILDAPVEENGRNFSGGERQRLELARAIATDPSLLVIDEGTSALDAATEVAIMHALRRRGMSCVVIAHRLSAIRPCDEILVVDRGRVVERGHHDALVEQGGLYVQLQNESTAA